MSANKPLTLFKLIMMAVVAIDSLKNLPTNALYGSQLIIYYGLAVVVFFIPTGLISVELATAWPETGGVYIWVREAFGKRMAFIAVWMQWLVAIIWYPSILSFIAATLAYLFSPELASNKLYIFISIQILFWMALLLVYKGLYLSSIVSTFSAIIGVIVPMFAIILLSLSWIYSGKPSHLNLLHDLQTEQWLSLDNLRLSITLLFSLMGMEMIAAHASDVVNPQKNYPRALLIAGVLILITVIPSSLAIMVVVPHDEISMTTSVIDAFIIFLDMFHLNWMKPWLIISLAIGSFGVFLTWLLASTRYLLISTIDGSLPDFLQRSNAKGMPGLQLVVQGTIFSILSVAFIFMPSVNSAFWFLSTAAAQIALLYYLFLFAAAWRLRTLYPNKKRPFKAGKSPIVFQTICTAGSIACILAFLFGFLPPQEINSNQIALYEVALTCLIIIGCSSGLIIYQLCQKEQIFKISTEQPPLP